MATTKSLNEQIAEVMNNVKTTKAQKEVSLVKLGLQKYEISLLLNFTPSRSHVSRVRPYQITFGVEMETFNVDRETMKRLAEENGLPIEYQGYNHRDSQTIYKFVSDGSIRNESGFNDEDCIECVSPVLSGRNGMKSLELACKTLNAVGAKVNRSTGLHVHIGAKHLTVEQYINVFVNYQMMEKVIDTFMANSRRANNGHYCQSLQGKNFAVCHTREDIWQACGRTRYMKVNPESFGRHQTIEFRQHQGSTDFKKIKAWVNFCAKLVTWSLDNRMAAPISSIKEIPFLTAAEKAFFTKRKNQLA